MTRNDAILTPEESRLYEQFSLHQVLESSKLNPVPSSANNNYFSSTDKQTFILNEIESIINQK